MVDFDNIEILHLETGTLPIKYIIAMRRIMYHRDIVSRNDSELVKKIYLAQKQKPMKYEWIKLLEKDFDLIGEIVDDSKIKVMKKKKYKKMIKEKITKAAFEFLQAKKNSHSKVKNIIYDKLNPQTYIKNNELSNEEVRLLFRLRSETTDVKLNFKTKFKDDLSCSLGCSEDETQEHLLHCKPLNDKLSDEQQQNIVEYNDIFDDKKQPAAVMLFMKLFDIRNNFESP